MKRFLVKGISTTILVVVLAFPPVTLVFAAGNPSGTGQPNQTCLSSTAPNEPGNASSAPGSAFNENGGTAGSVYANPGSTGGTASGNTHVVAQYDVACFQVSHH